MAKIIPNLDTKCPACHRSLTVRYDKDKNEYTTTAFEAPGAAAKEEPIKTDEENPKPGSNDEPTEKGTRTGEKPNVGAATSKPEDVDEMGFGFYTD